MRGIKTKKTWTVGHCVCWYAWGFIEGFVRELEEGVKSVKWEEMDYENKKCKFVFLK